MMSLPQLLDGLGRGRLEVVQKAFSLHHNAFRSEFLKHLSCGATVNTEEHIGKMAILFETILNHSKKYEANSVFGQSLLNLTIDHIKVLEQELDGFKLSTNSTNSIQQKKAVLELLNFHLNHLKALVKEVPRSPTQTETKVMTVAHVHASSTFSNLMKNLSSKSDDEVVRHTLLSNEAADCAKKVLLSRGGRSAAQVNEFFERVADAYVSELLLKKQIDKAKDVISSSGRDIWPTLKALCLNTTDTNIRDYLAFELNTVNILEPSEIEAWKFLILIEGIIKKLDLGLDVTDENLLTMKPLDGGNKFGLSIARLLTLSPNAKSLLLTELYIETLDGTLESMLEKVEFWRYLISNDKLEILIKWVQISCSDTKAEPEKHDRLTTFLSSWNITQDMIDYIPTSNCTVGTKECLLDYLSRFTLYISEELNDVQRRLLRDIHTSQIFDKNGTLEDILVQFCAQYNVPDLLVSCDIRTNTQSSAWLKLYSQYQDLKNDHDFKRSLLCAIDLSADYLEISKSDSKWISLAPLILSEKSLYELTDMSIDENKESSKELHAALSHHPKLTTLLNSIFEDENPVDLSLHQLLKEKFVCQILKEQSLCSLFNEDASGSEVDFSHDPSILLHGHQESLDFQYFLKQGRPCHASMLVLAEVIRSFGKPSRKLLKRYILPAHELALLNPMDRTITGSCIAFIEMLGETTLSLRTYIAALNQIASFQSDNALTCNNITNGSAHQLLIDGRAINPQEVFDMLMCSLPLNIHMQGLAVQLANLHNLPLPRSFLEHCAQIDDWISFILFCQIYSYPPDIMNDVAQKFKSAALKDHFESFLQKCSAPTKSAGRSRAEFSRQKSLTPSSEVSGSKDSEHTTITSGGTQINDVGVSSGAKDSLFGVLLACHGCGDSAEALLHACVEIPCPVLAVLSDYYQADDEAKLVAWLASWLPKEERVKYEFLPKNIPWPQNMVESVILNSLEMSCSNLLSGFRLFLPKHPLVLVLILIEEFSTRDKLKNVECLFVFIESSSKLGNEKKGDPWCLNSASFLMNICSKLLIKALECLKSTNDVIQFIQILCETNESFFPDEALIEQLKTLLAILDVLSNTDVQINVSNYLKDSNEEILKCTELLTSLKLYKEASSISGKTFVILEQSDKFKKWLENNYQDFKEFCADCNACFEEAVVDPLDVFEFFQICLQDLTKNVDRWRALQYALKWLQSSISKSAQNDLSSQADKIEIEMWKCCVCENDPAIFAVLADELQNSSLSKLCTKELGIHCFNFTEVFHQCDSSCKEQPCPSKLVNCLLDAGDIVSASRVSNFFQSNHQDLEILHSCVSLVEGTLKVHEIPTHWVLFPTLKFGEAWQVSSANLTLGKEKESSFSVESMKSVQNPSSTNLKVLSVIQELCKQLKHGKDIGKQLIACYRLAINLGLAYKDVISITDPLKLLRTAMSHVHSNDYSVASDIMIAFRMSSAERVQFLGREIIAAISKGPAAGNVKVFLLWGHDIEQYFQHLLELVPDPSLLGNELMNMVCKLSITDKSTPKTVLTTAVELLVRTHDCYAAGCHMEGISQVLRSVNNFTQILKTRSEWALLVRLLTGIQRYTEMNYIFKVLKENDHFEFLLRKDSFKPLGFKLALLDWLRRECSNDTALLKMTAAHFQMHQQEAELWQKEGKDRLSDLVACGLSNNQKTKQALEMALQDFSHASECYLQGDMVNHAMICAHQAELVALQQHMLSSHSDGSILCVIQLDSKSVGKLVSTLGFHQALIVARAYNHRTDWAAALFYHCISPGLSSEEYFSAWSACMELTPLLIQNVAYRLQRTSGITREMTTNMQWLLGHVKDMDVRYKIASELGLKDMVESLLQAPEVAYLKDTVWQSGFKRQPI